AGGDLDERCGFAQLVEQIARAREARIGANCESARRLGCADTGPSRCLCAEQESIRRRAPHGARAALRYPTPSVTIDGDAVDQHGVWCEAPEALESRELAARVVVNTFGEVHDERRIRRSRAEPACDVAARLTARAGRLSGEKKRVCPPVSAHHADW